MTEDEFLKNLKTMLTVSDISDYQKQNILTWLDYHENTHMLPQYGDIVQIHPEFGEVFGGHLLVVTEVLGWGVKGYIMYLKKRKDCFYKTFHYKDIIPCGKAKWVFDSKKEESKSESSCHE